MEWVYLSFEIQRGNPNSKFLPLMYLPFPFFDKIMMWTANTKLMLLHSQA